MGTATLRSILELCMQYIPTTATAFEKLRSEAKVHRRSSGLAHSQALEAVAVAHGYANWKHVTTCRDETAAQPSSQAHQLKAESAGSSEITTAPQGGSFSSPRDSWVIARLDVSKLAPGLYSYSITYGGHELLADEGFESISDAIYSAADITGPILGFEVAYSGVSAGTFPLDYLRADPQEVASRAVEMVAELHAAAR